MDNNIFSEISNNTIDRYSKRFSRLGVDVKSLGWGSSDQQTQRFIHMLDSIDLHTKTILDIGCGFGDLYAFLHKNSISFSSYTGLDINKDFINVAVDNFNADDVDFKLCDILNDSVNIRADVGIMLGLLNYKYQSSEINLSFTSQMLRNAFNTVNNLLYVDFISTQLDPSYPSESFIFYHKPSQVLEMALEITPNVKLIHSHPAIPQKEFSIILYK